MLSTSLTRLTLGVSVVPRLIPVLASASPSYQINLPPMITPMCALHTSDVVERARQSTRIRKKKINDANKKKKEERLRKNPPPIPKKVQLMLISKGLGREPRPWRRPDNKPFPVDDVWAERNWHTWPRFSVTEAVLMLREHHHPTMLNMPDALVWVRLELNMQGSKKEKFIDAFSVMTPVAHPFERGVAEKSVLVFVQNPDAAKAAEAAGAARVGGLELVEDIAKGKVDVAEIDHFIAHEDMMTELKPLLGVLREKMPKKIAGTVGTNLDQMVKTFGHGMSVSVVKPKQTLGMAEDPSFAFCELQVGRLTMEPSQIEANLEKALEVIREKKPSKRAGGWITRAQLYCEGPCKSKFDVHHDLVDDQKYKDHIAEQRALESS